MIGSGWLPADRSPKNDVGQWLVNRNVYPTRYEEYRWIRGMLKGDPLRVLDAGAGFDPVIHFMPAILGDDGHWVVAVDEHPDSVKMPDHPNVLRIVGKMQTVDFPAKDFDAWICVSVLEHIPQVDHGLTLAEAYRLLKPGGLLLITTDEIEPSYLTYVAENAGFEVGPIDELVSKHGELNPPVSWLAAVRP